MKWLLNLCAWSVGRSGSDVHNNCVQATTGARKSELAKRQTSIGDLDRMEPLEFTRCFLMWSTAHALSGPIDLKRLHILALEFADETKLVPPRMSSFRRMLKRLGVASGQRFVHPYEFGYGTSKRQSRRARAKTLFYVLPRHFPIREVRPNIPASSAQLDLFGKEKAQRRKP